VGQCGAAEVEAEKASRRATWVRSGGVFLQMLGLMIVLMKFAKTKTRRANAKHRHCHSTV